MKLQIKAPYMPHGKETTFIFLSAGEAQSV
jgi:hypothetical protein